MSVFIELPKQYSPGPPAFLAQSSLGIWAYADERRKVNAMNSQNFIGLGVVVLSIFQISLQTR
ncbi:MAG: hypothetical protein IPK96_06065 [Flammeovirgaceae bacterium]|nr:hypothetical protein [Flammeovirgaceae bacterium]